MATTSSSSTRQRAQILGQGRCGGGAHHADIGALLHQQFDLVVAVQFAHGQFDIGIAVAIAVQGIGHTLDEGARCGEADVEAPALAMLGHLCHQTGVIGLGQRAARLGFEHAAHLGQLHPAARPLEQAHAQFFLQCTDLLAERGLGHAQTLGRAAEMQFLGHTQKTAQLFQFHSAFIKTNFKSINLYSILDRKRSLPHSALAAAPPLQQSLGPAYAAPITKHAPFLPAKALEAGPESGRDASGGPCHLPAQSRARFWSDRCWISSRLRFNVR
jgi:hypothetical protein